MPVWGGRGCTYSKGNMRICDLGVRLAKELLKREDGDVELEAVSLRTSETADPIAISLQIREKATGDLTEYQL